MRTRNVWAPECWDNLPVGERDLIWAILRLLRSAKRSRVREAAIAAAKWETSLTFFIKLRLIQGKAENKKYKAQMGK